MIHGSGPDGSKGFANVVGEGNGAGGSTVPGFFLQEEMPTIKTNENIQSLRFIYATSTVSNRVIVQEWRCCISQHLLIINILDSA